MTIELPEAPSPLSRALLAHSLPGIPSLYEYQAQILTYLLHGRSPEDFADASQLAGATALSAFSANASDLLVYSPTGFGKTLTYVTPILHYLKTTTRVGDAFRLTARPDGVSALVLVPTKELAHQVHAVFAEILGDLVVELSGEHPLSEEIDILQGTPGGPAGPDVVVCVANRLALHAEPTARDGNTCRWNCLRYLVVDEADRLLATGFGNWLTALRYITAEADELRGAKTNIVTSRPDVLGTYWLAPNGKPQHETPGQGDPSSDQAKCKRSVKSDSITPGAFARPFHLQKIICTATDVKSFRGMRTLRLFHPLCVRARLEKDRLKQKVLIASKSSALETLIKTVKKILSKKKNQCLVFCRSTHDVQKIYNSLTRASSLEVPRSAGSSIAIDDAECATATREKHFGVLVGSDSTRQRKRAFERFSQGELRLLISSDVSARGLNILSVTHVVQYGLPVNADEYIHRIGRTARCGRRGKSVLILAKDEQSKFIKMKELITELRPTSKISVSELG